MDCIKIRIDPSWNDKIYDISACLDSWIRIKTEFRPRTYLETDGFNQAERSIYIVCESAEELNGILALLKNEHSNKLIREVKSIKVFGTMKNQIYPDNLNGASKSVKYYNAVYSWLLSEIRAYESRPEFRTDRTMMRYWDELTNVIGGMKFIKAA